MAQDAVNLRVVVIGGSAGSLEVVFGIVSALPRRSGAAYVIVLHRKNDNDSLLADLLSSRTAMPVTEVEDKEHVQANHVYIAPPDYHLLFEDEQTFSLDSSEKVHYSRPSIDVTFESAADVFGPRAVGVLLSGANADGADGLKRIKNAGGYTVVQHPESAEVNFMPRQAIKNDAATAVLTTEELVAFLQRFPSVNA